jgi:sugar phosphate isomerase/epimerase
MQLGVMGRTFSPLSAIAGTTRACGVEAIQLNLQSAGLESIPAVLDESKACEIGETWAAQGIEIVAVSETFNTIHPDPPVRADGIRRLGLLASRCRALGNRVITICTGTRDAGDMWRPHPANSAAEARRDLMATMRELLRFAADYGVTLAFEPETANVIDTAAKARELVEELGSLRTRG